MILAYIKNFLKILGAIILGLSGAVAAVGFAALSGKYGGPLGAAGAIIILAAAGLAILKTMDEA